MKWMVFYLGHDSALQGHTGPGTTWANEMNFVMERAPGAGSIARPVDPQSNIIPLSYGCPLYEKKHCKCEIDLMDQGTIVLNRFENIGIRI